MIATRRRRGARFQLGLGVLVLLVGLAASTFYLARGLSPAPTVPTCGGTEMGPNDICPVLSHGYAAEGRGGDYGEVLAAERRDHDRWPAFFSGSLLIVLLGGGLVTWRWSAAGLPAPGRP